jgi:hypothetical protein
VEKVEGVGNKGRERASIFNKTYYIFVSKYKIIFTWSFENNTNQFSMKHNIF